MSSEAARNAAHRWAEWHAQAPKFPWRDMLGVEPFGDVPLPQPLVSARQVGRLIQEDGGVALFLDATWTLPDAVVAASVLVDRGMITNDPDTSQVDDWPMAVTVRGLRPFTRCAIAGCGSPVYSQRHLLGGGGRPPVRCLMHAERPHRAIAALGRERAAIKSWLGPLKPAQVP